MASKWVDQFLGSNSKSFTQDEIRKSKFGEYFEHLQQNLDRFAEENSLFRNANEILSLDVESNNLELFIDSLLALIPSYEFEFRRLILISEVDHIRDSYSADNAAREFAYLDPQIISLLETNARVFVRDTSKIHTLKFQPDKDIPKSVLGLSLETIPGWKCFLWFAHTSEIDLTKDQVEGLELIRVTTANSISRIIKKISLTKEYQLWSSAFNLNPYPCFIFINNRIAGMNREAEKISNWGDLDSKDKFGEMILSEIKRGKTHIEINDLSFRLISSIHNAGEETENILVLLVNENEITIQRNYLINVMQAISLNLATPLNNILGFSGMIPLLAGVDGSQQDYLNRITRETKGCLTFTSDLLELSRFSGDKPLVISEVSVGELTSSLLEVSQHILKQKRISIEDKTENPEHSVNVDVTLFGQALYLILEYILDQLESGRKISILVSSDDTEFRYHLSDNGKGISDIDVTLLNKQEPDSAIDQRIRTARGIMRLHGGRLVINSELGKGSEYIFLWSLK